MPANARAGIVDVRQRGLDAARERLVVELLSQMPEGGDDRDFERVRDFGRDIDL